MLGSLRHDRTCLEAPAKDVLHLRGSVVSPRNSDVCKLGNMSVEKKNLLPDTFQRT